MIFFGLVLCNAQTKNDTMTYEKTINDFVKAAENNPLWGNGANVDIEKPENDKDALIKGFRLTHMNDEQNGGWKILFAKDIKINADRDNSNQEKYRAVLYEYKAKQYIVLYTKEKDNEYFFRIYGTGK